MRKSILETLDEIEEDDKDHLVDTSELSIDENDDNWWTGEEEWNLNEEDNDF